MPNSGFQGQINERFYGNNKGNQVPLGNRYVTGNLPNPAFWRFIADQSPGTDTPRIMTTTAVLAPHRPNNSYSSNFQSTKSGGRSQENTLPMASPTRGSSAARSDHAPKHHVAPPRTRGSAREMPMKHLVAINSLAPFATSLKPTCGFFFSRGTDNAKHCLGIPYTDLVKNRYYVK